MISGTSHIFIEQKFTRFFYIIAKIAYTEVKQPRVGSKKIRKLNINLIEYHVIKIAIAPSEDMGFSTMLSQTFDKILFLCKTKLFVAKHYK
ncbi:MAG: hypothetical protein KME46_12995 [Brasilonema angustatum HA4187-MV1]|nr:hypothetical protein [Brasilonema angustatum HA4187-MV1]